MSWPLWTSTDLRYIYHSFNAFANVNLCSEESRPCSKSWVLEKQGKGGTTARKSDMFNMDSIDSHPIVNHLGAALGEEKAMYFFTQTCNQQAFFGV